MVIITYVKLMIQSIEIIYNNKTIRKIIMTLFTFNSNMKAVCAR